MNYVADTHALVWYFTRDSRLGRGAAAAFNEADALGVVYIPTIVLAEIMYISQRGRISISFEKTLEYLERALNYTILPLDVPTLKLASSIAFPFEMHDKLIVASALAAGASLITKDEVITKSRIIATVWE